MYYAETPDAAHDIHDLKVNLLGESFIRMLGFSLKK